jgi:hypothetical protein
MRRYLVTVMMVVVAAPVVLASTASARPTGTCPPEVSGFTLYEFQGEPGDPVPAPGEEPLWDLEVAGAFEEGFTSIEEWAAASGRTGQDLYAALIEFLLVIDMNADRAVCVQRFPTQQEGIPAWLFNTIDNQAQVP